MVKTAIFDFLRVIKSLTVLLVVIVGVSKLHAQGQDDPAWAGTDRSASPAVPGSVPTSVVDAPIHGTGFPALETYVPSVRPFSSILTDEVNVLEATTNAWLETFAPREYLRLLPVEGRVSYVDLPKDAKPLKEGNLSRLTSITNGVPPSITNTWVSTQKIEDLVAWYGKRHGLRFALHRSVMSGGDTVVVANAVQRINDEVVTIVLWTPTLASNGKALRRTSRQATSIYVEERAFRHRSKLIAEGQDALVELTWQVPFADLIQSASLRYQIDPFLIAALIQQESGFDPEALSVDSAMGLAQLIPTTAEMMGVADAQDPAQAIDGGTHYLKMMLRRFGGNVEFALAAYNAGPGAVEKYNGVPPYTETRDYVQRIMKRWRQKAMGDYAGQPSVSAVG